MASSFFITTPIYYVNGKPHLGHAYTTFMADSLNRFHKMLGKTTWFLTGTDEHGDKIVQAAEQAGQSPQAFVDAVSATFKNLWPQLGIANDQFIRTTDENHKKTVQAFMQRVYDTGDIYFGEYGGHYCLGCERFYTEKELENGLCPQHLTKPDYIAEKNYFFRMSKYQSRLREHILANPDFIRPERYKNEVLALLDSGDLEDLCISRPKSRLTWGIELPFDNNYVCYVWFDALINYIAALDWPNGQAFAEFWPGAQHLVAKDILKPHAIFWPTMLMAAGLPLYQHLNVHGYWLSRDAKMSKSLGNVINPMDIPAKYGVDAFRYFLLREMHFGSDGSFSEEALITRVNADLANDLGNLFSRVLSMAAKYHNSQVCNPQGPMQDADTAMQTLSADALHNYISMVQQTRFSTGLEALWELVRALNKYVDSQAPWALAKQGDTARLERVMHTLLECLYKIACAVWPVMPQTAATMLNQLGIEVSRETPPLTDLPAEAARWGRMRPGLQLAPASNLFPRIEVPAVDAPAKAGAKPEAKPKAGADAKAAAKAQPAPAKAAPQTDEKPKSLDFTDFLKLDLRTGLVVSAERHPNADTLLKLMVDLGEEAPRQIISGLANYFTPESLVGKTVCVVANLAMRKIRGLESHGMVLTAEHGDKLALLCTDGPAAPGSTIR